MKNNYKIIFRIILVIIIVLQNNFYLFSQNINNEIEKDIKNFFFNLNIDSCQNQILKEIDSNKTYRFIYSGKVDTFGHGNYQFISREDLLHPCFKLNDNKQSIVDCDSTFIQLQPAYLGRTVSHVNIDYERLYGHRISILMYFHDSTFATTTYKHLTDSISAKLNRTFSSSEFTIDNIVAGSSSKIIIDKKNNGYEYERNLEISIRKYDKLFEVKIDFEKLTITQEICKD